MIMMRRFFAMMIVRIKIMVIMVMFNINMVTIETMKMVTIEIMPRRVDIGENGLGRCWTLST